MGWQIIVAIIADMITICATIIGGIWAIEMRFEKRLNRTEDNLKADIEKNRNLIPTYIVTDQHTT